MPDSDLNAIKVATYKLARKAYLRPVEKPVNNAGGMWFPGEKE